MTRKRGVMVAGGVILGVVLAGSMAWGYGRWGCGWHHGHGGKEVAGRILRHMDEKANQLNLTAPQKAKYYELRSSMEANLTKAVEERKTFRESFHTELAKDTPDVAVLTGRMKAKIGDVSGAMQKNLDLFTAFYESLDANQKKELMTEFRERMERRHRWAPHEEE